MQKVWRGSPTQACDGLATGLPANPIMAAMMAGKIARPVHATCRPFPNAAFSWLSDKDAE